MSISEAPVTEERTSVTTRSGLNLAVRAAHPGDEDLLRTFFEHVSVDDLRFRFLSGMNHVSEEQIARMTHVDHWKSECWLAFNGDELVGTAMLAADPALATGEVAISVRADRKNRGIGWSLLDHVAGCARGRGIRKLQSIESFDNHAAIGLEREMGFSAKPYPGDPHLVLVEADLG